MLSILQRLLDWRLEPVELIDCQNHFRSCETPVRFMTLPRRRDHFKCRLATITRKV